MDGAVPSGVQHDHALAGYLHLLRRVPAAHLRGARGYAMARTRTPPLRRLAGYARRSVPPRRRDRVGDRPGDSTLDVGTPAARPFLRSGFADDEREGERTFAWVEGRHASIVAPRRSSRRATVDLECL